MERWLPEASRSLFTTAVTSDHNHFGMSGCCVPSAPMNNVLRRTQMRREVGGPLAVEAIDSLRDQPSEDRCKRAFDELVIADSAAIGSQGLEMNAMNDLHQPTFRAPTDEPALFHLE